MGEQPVAGRFHLSSLQGGELSSFAPVAGIHDTDLESRREGELFLDQREGLEKSERICRSVELEKKDVPRALRSRATERD